MKRKVNINRPEISADEINQRKNFDSVLNQHIKINTKPFFKKPWFLSSVAITTIAVVTTLVIINNKPDKPGQAQTTNNQQPITNSYDSIALAEFYAKEEAKPCINPPLKGINIPYTTYKVNAQKGGTLVHETGSKLIIPKNAFADANGKTIKGEVEIRYREFHDVVDFLVSGIPMTYDSAGNRYHFESAGMMEILAYQNGNPVNMMPDKTINVELASNDDSPKYNLYKLDTIKNDWSCIGKDKIVKKSDASNQQYTKRADTVGTPSEIVKIETKKTELITEKKEQIAALPKLPLEPKKPEQAKKGRYTFDLDVDAKEFPELALYKGAMFEVSDENKNFDASMYKITWDDAKLKKGSSKNENYIMTLQKGSKQYEFVVAPVFEGKNYETAMKSFEEKFKQYNTVLEKRSKEEKRIEEEYNSKIAALKKKQEELEREWKRQEDERVKNMSTEQKVFRTFNVNGFGVYNCDNPMKYPQGVITNAELLNDKNFKLLCYDVYLVDKKLNGMYTYYRNPVTKFTYNPKSENILWTIESGVLYYIKPEDFKNFTSANGLQQVKMKPVPAELKTPEEIKTFFGI